MQFTILAYGSRGDVQPYIALGRGLLQRGHSVRLAAPGLFRELIESFDMEFAPLSGDPSMLIRLAADKADVRAGLLRTLRTMLNYATPLAHRILDEVNDACRGADAIVHSLLLGIAGHETALRLDVPDFAALVFLVFAPTRAFPCALFPELPLGGWYNCLTHELFSQAAWLGSRLGYMAVRRSHPELPRLTEWPYRNSGVGRRTPILFGASPQVIPQPMDWDEHVHLTGYWFLDEGKDWSPPTDLQAFLESGPPPVYFGFGSTIPPHASRLTEVVLQALQSTGQRGVLQAGWGGLTKVDLPANIFPLESAPFDWLFPRMAAAVHHGGAGTTAEALRAGIPSIIIPFIADQAFWGQRVARIRAGTPPIRYDQLSASSLAQAVRCAIEDESLRQSCANFSLRLKNEHGAATAAQILENYMENDAITRSM